MYRVLKRTVMYVGGTLPDPLNEGSRRYEPGVILRHIASTKHVTVFADEEQRRCFLCGQLEDTLRTGRFEQVGVILGDALERLA